MSWPASASFFGLHGPAGSDVLHPGRFGVCWMTAEGAHYGSDAMPTWLRQIGAYEIAVHLDLEAIDLLARSWRLFEMLTA